MSELIELIECSEVPVGQAREVTAMGRIFAVYNVDGNIHVTDGICPHAGGPLGKGTLRGGTVTCPWHGWQFDVTTGQHCLNGRICQKTYQSQIVNGRVCISLENEA